MREQNCPEQLEQLKKEFDEFAYIVSHDFKAPIRAISNLSSWIEEDLGDNTNEDVIENIRLLRNRASRLEHMIEALLRYSRVGRHDIEQEQTDTNELIRSLAKEFDGKVNVQATGKLPEFYTYNKKLHDVFRNLVANTATFSKKEHSSVLITCNSNDPEFYEFSVADNGQGVPAGALDKIFDLYYTVSAKDTHDTVGAGLAISKKIIQFVQGSIRAEHNNENGLTVRFTWPKHVSATNISQD